MLIVFYDLKISILHYVFCFIYFQFHLQMLNHLLDESNVMFFGSLILNLPSN